MTDMIESASSAGLLAAMDANMVAYWAAYGRGEGATLQTTECITWFHTGIPQPLFNGAFPTSLNTDEVKAAIDDLQARMNERGGPALWWIGPRAIPKTIGPLLEQHGLQLVEEIPGMVVDLARINEQAEAPANFNIQRVNDSQSQKLWARMAGSGSGFPEQATDQVVRLEASLNDAAYRAQPRYIGYLDGAPVACSALVLDSGLAGIYAVATLPEARNKGIGRLMTVRPLLVARQLGYRVGILQASSMGYPIYKKIGFLDVCTYRLYLQTPSQV